MTKRRVEFWLDDEIDSELMLLEAIADLKANRRFHPVLRQALRLVLDLDAGNTSELESMFPELVKRLQTDYLIQVAETGGLSVGGGVQTDVEATKLGDVSELEESIEQAQERLSNSNSWLFEE